MLLYLKEQTINISKLKDKYREKNLFWVKIKAQRLQMLQTKEGGQERQKKKIIKLEKEPIHAASSPVNKIITKNTAVIIDTPTHFQVIMTNIEII